MGEGLPFTLPRLEHRLRHQAPDSHGKHKLPPTEYLRKHFFLTTSGVFRSQTLLDTILEVGSDRILFSIDSPYESMDEQNPWFDTCSMSENDRQKIGRDNAFKLFKRDVKLKTLTCTHNSLCQSLPFQRIVRGAALTGAAHQRCTMMGCQEDWGGVIVQRARQDDQIISTTGTRQAGSRMIKGVVLDG